MIGRHAHASWRAVPLCAAAFVLAVTTGRLFAHHSHGNYDMTTYTSIKGTIKEVHWMNPHTWIYLDVKKDDGKVEAWAFEMGSPNRLMRYGWNQDSLASGTTVTIAGSQARDGSMKAAVDTVTLPDGKRLFGAQDTAN